jgi:uncharacterized protein YbjT (DUF2867 family)
MRFLVAGATGLVGREVVALLKTSQHFVRTASRNPGRAAAMKDLVDDVIVADATRPGSLAGICGSIDVVISALGAPVSPMSMSRTSFMETDLVANRALLEEARSSGVRRFVYVSVHPEPSYAETRYLRAHAEFEAALRASGLEFGVVRPTGIFGAFAEMLPMARLGVIPVIGDGSARSNPIHEIEVARHAVEIATGSGSGPIRDVGGPDVLTRREIAELAFAALRRKQRCWSTPPGVMRASARAIGLVNPRNGDFLDFIVRASLSDCVAPMAGELRLAAYLESRVRAS